MWNEFDVDAFVRAVRAADSDDVVWSVTWIDYLFPAPIAAIDATTGPGIDRTADRDLLMEIATKLRANGIDLLVHYHLGHGEMAQAGWPGTQVTTSGASTWVPTDRSSG